MGTRKILNKHTSGSDAEVLIKTTLWEILWKSQENKKTIEETVNTKTKTQKKDRRNTGSKINKSLNRNCITKLHKQWCIIMSHFDFLFSTVYSLPIFSKMSKKEKVVYILGRIKHILYFERRYPGLGERVMENTSPVA